MSSMISNLPVRETRRKVKTMMEEDLNSELVVDQPFNQDDQDLDWSRSFKKKTSTTASTKSSKGSKSKLVPMPSTPPRSTTSPNSSPRLAIRFGGKVYRSLDTTLNSYARDGNFLGEPDEEVGDAEMEKQDVRRKEMGQKMRVEAGKKRTRGDSDEDDLWIHPRSNGGSTSPLTPTKRSVPTRTEPLRSRVLPRSNINSPPPQLGLPFSTINSSRAAFNSSFSSTTPLPPVLADLLALYTALESALLFHLANEGSSVASSTSRTNAAGEATIRIPNVIDLPDLSKKMESGGRRFGEKELSRLLWVWEGCGIGDESWDEDELNIKMQGKEVGGMGFIVSKTRCASSNSIVNTYGIGISVGIKTNPQLPKFELLAPPGSPTRSPKRTVPSPMSPASIGRGRDGMSVVALWSQGNEARREEFSRRLRDWGKRCADEELTRSLQLPTPPRSQSITSPSSSPLKPQTSFPSILPEIPRAILPSLSAAIPKVEGTSSPSPRKKSGVVDVFGPVITAYGSTGTLMEGYKVPAAIGSGSAVDRMKAMRDRIQAKADSRKPSAYHADLSALSDGIVGKKSLKREKEVIKSWKVLELERSKRNSMLSRLGNVGDSIWMLFDVGRRRSILLSEVGESIAKSSKVGLSLEEAVESLQLLCELCPRFVQIKVIDRQDWLCMKGEISLKEVKEIVRGELAKSSR